MPNSCERTFIDGDYEKKVVNFWVVIATVGMEKEFMLI